MSETKLDVRYVAELARLELTEEETSLFERQLGMIVQYVEKIGELDVDGIEPTLHGQSRVNAFREDTVVPSMDHEAALRNAPDRHGEEFKLPKIVEDA
ncbi:MAG: Asp-tRNA(Asn)/Glu-tRNA(Gln) amidotransferase subunit GatC [Kiritimatiellae bacterium]|nr:Asp-tRNA(Asn)/Glu-tRNA(Gln) amidotransferase subunit GatC [Kiritimatiellia bacterium]MBP5227829.1 Asp-tRNA(Asn)/Glu-tRNA(Gln) amidotransferase subunit GatC [Kiritimatiellia bacterium]